MLATVNRLFIDFLFVQIYISDHLIFSADMINKKGRVNCAIKSCHCTCAVTKRSPIALPCYTQYDAEVDCDRPLLS